MSREVPEVRIAIFGLGYVGTVTAACLAEEGHSIFGVDTDPFQLERMRRGECPVMEEGLPELVERGIQRGAIRVTADHCQAIQESDVAIVCVGTPGFADGSQDTAAVRLVAAQIGSALKNRSGRYLIVIRSTLLPGSTSDIVIPILETESGKEVDRDIDVCLSPEFLREGTSIRDFYDPPLTVVGVRRREVAYQVKELFGSRPFPFFVTSIAVAEMVKYGGNAFHALKIAFANEIGALCKSMNIDGREVMEILCADKKLNIAAAYLEPGFAFGGSCLPKDLRALAYQAHNLGCDTPLLRSVVPSNNVHIDRAVRLVLDAARQRVGLLGLSFKPGSDDLRASPLVVLAKALLDRGLKLAVFDGDLRLEKLMGENRRFMMSQIPNLEQIMVPTAEELFRCSELVIVGKRSCGSLESLQNNAREDLWIVDLVGIRDFGIHKRANYRGICW
jgi:GDP-mannose 6-dehydrogenase